ncbi:MAG TPA: nuclear transport factor 2 family protein [Thermoleophilaceae bacterium]|nr:nuclear transport factor 2 family protein [Thermoleophilaceae bacterium]
MSGLLAALRTGDADALNRLTADDVAFHSPVTDYSGRANVVHLLRTIGDVLDTIEAEETFDAPGVTVTLAKVSVGGRKADALVREEVDADGALSDLTLMLRPLDVLMAAVELMGEALAADPLPEQLR